MTFPQVDMSEEEKAKVRAEFLSLTTEATEGEVPLKRGRGRPKGSRNKPKPGDYAPFRKTTPTLEDTEDTEVAPLSIPRLSTRDQREVAERLAGILQAGTGIGAVVRPYFQMTDEEANAIAIPLASYLVRTEATSKTAARILDEYDVAAFALALLAYVVRVYLDFDAERKALKAENESLVVSPDRVQSFDGREFEGTVGEAISKSPQLSQSGEERPVSREHASASQGGWVPSQI